MSLSVKGHLRAAYEKDPAEFARLIDLFIKAGESAFTADEPGAKAGRAKEIGDSVQAMQLAMVMIRSPKAGSKRKVLLDMVSRNVSWSSPNPSDPKNREADYYGKEMNFNTLKTKVSKAEGRYKSDPEFAEKVDMYRRLIPMLDD